MCFVWYAPVPKAVKNLYPQNLYLDLLKHGRIVATQKQTELSRNNAIAPIAAMATLSFELMVLKMEESSWLKSLKRVSNYILHILFPYS